jgi:hypothetical protein
MSVRGTCSDKCEMSEKYEQCIHDLACAEGCELTDGTCTSNCRDLQSQLASVGCSSCDLRCDTRFSSCTAPAGGDKPVCITDCGILDWLMSSLGFWFYLIMWSAVNFAMGITQIAIGLLIAKIDACDCEDVAKRFIITGSFIIIVLACYGIPLLCSELARSVVKDRFCGSNSTPTPLPRRRFGVGQTVYWTSADADVPAGTPGQVIGFLDNGRARVKFPGGTWNFGDSQLRSEASGGEAAERERRQRQLSSQLQVGEKVERRDSGESWRVGFVTQLAPLKVNMSENDPSKKGYSWHEVRKLNLALPTTEKKRKGPVVPPSQTSSVQRKANVQLQNAPKPKKTDMRQPLTAVAPVSEVTAWLRSENLEQYATALASEGYGVLKFLVDMGKLAQHFCVFVHAFIVCVCM